mmetsp:Transcript_77000/g.223512  ORF Transcript_77000/g.223512 Transcript_77000/m.223512 type:complete len:154 (-) Transcript_77000:189-650(-)
MFSCCAGAAENTPAENVVQPTFAMELPTEAEANGEANVDALQKLDGPPVEEQKIIEEPPAEEPKIPEDHAFVLTFRQDGKDHRFALNNRPLGFKFRLQKPVVVTSVNPGSAAEAAGVKPGMELYEVCGESIEDLGPKEILANLKAKVDLLPEK